MSRLLKRGPSSMSYARILHLAYIVTINHPELWFFGLFLVGVFNIIVLNTLGLPQTSFDPTATLTSVLQLHTRVGMAVSVFVFVAAGLVVSGIARIILVTLVTRYVHLDIDVALKMESVLKWLKTVPGFSGQHSQVPVYSIVKRSFRATLFASICANLFLLCALIVVGSPQLLFASQTGSQTLFIMGVLFLPLAFLGLYINLFPPYFTIIFQCSIKDSFRLAHDLLVQKFQQIVAFVVVLSVLYVLGFAAIFSLTHFIQTIAANSVLILAHLGFFTESAIISAVRFGGMGMAWVLLGVLNVFINSALLILFLDLIKPLTFTAAVEASQVSSAPSQLS